MIAGATTLFMTGGKKPKSAVNYGPGGEHCHACKFFVEGSEEMSAEGEIGQCLKVEGAIGGHMWCKLFEWQMKPPK